MKISNKIILWVARFVGFSGLLMLFTIYEVGRLSVQLGNVQTIEYTVDICVILLWIYVKINYYCGHMGIKNPTWLT